MVCSHFSVADRFAGARCQQQQGAGSLGATHGSVRQLDDAVSGRVLRAEQVERDFRVIQDESEFVVKVFTGGHGEAAQAVKLADKRFDGLGGGGSLFLHT